MSLKKPLFFPFLFVLLTYHAVAQDKWDLKRCVEYAVNNNISVKQQDVSARLAALIYKQNKLSQIPTLGFNGNISLNSGYAQNPQNFQLSTSNLYYNSLALQSQANIYNFGSLHNSIAGAKFAWEAAMALTDNIRNNVSLNVANAYLNFLLANETAKAGALQVGMSRANLDNTNKLVRAGSVPELNAAELESQLAQDSATYTTDLSNVQQDILVLKAYMGYDAAAPFDLDTPPVESIPVDPISELQPDNVFALAMINQPLQKSDKLQIESAIRYAKSNHAAMLPNLTAFGSLSSTYTNQTQELNYYQTQPGYPIGTTTVAGTTYPVTSLPYEEPVLKGQPYFSQLNTAFRQTIGVSLNIPIFNGGTLKTNYQRAELNLKNYQLAQEQDNLTLKENIYTSYALAVAAMQKFEMQKKVVEATQRSFDYAQKRYNVGLLETIDLLTQQNNYFKAKIDLISDQFDYVFKMKVLEFWKGMGIKL
jgi:outer membrane protein